MIVAFSAGRKGSKGFPDKNIYRVGHYYLMEYPLIAAKNCELIDHIYYSTDCDIQKKLAEKHGTTIIDRPLELATDKALLEDVYVYMFNRVKESYDLLLDRNHIDEETYRKYFQIEFVVILMSNAPCINSKIMKEMILRLRENKEADSICTISKYNMYHPNRSRKLSGPYLSPYVPECINGLTTCDRDCNDDSYIYDCSCAVIRPYCLERIEEGILPQKWLGNEIIGYKQEIPAIDVDFLWQIGQIECWLKRYSREK